MADRPKIKILVSCHKPVVYPKSELFLPVHVGAEGKTPIAGMQPDNEGENISDRNFTYCELTAQYWAWKNLDADYVGQCHYRRYFCFDGQKHKANDHKQIEEECLSPYSIAKYHIADEERIRSIVESHDLVTAPYWNVLGSVTLDGTKKTIRSHMVGYGLLSNADIDELIRICREKQPEYADDLVSYLNGSSYLGYNCFIMRRDLFDRLCEFEFSILEEFDRNFSYEDMTTTRKRICGYFGEILYSVFVNHLKKTDKCSIAKAPLVFFEETPASFVPTVAEGKTNIFWRYPEATPDKLSVAVRTLVHELDKARDYRLTIIHDHDFKAPELKKLLTDLPSNLEVVDGTFQALDIPSVAGDMSDAELHILLPFLLPSLLAGTDGGAHGRVLWVEGCAAFVGDPAKVIDAAGAAPFSALSGLWLEKEFNKPFNWDFLARYIEVVDGREMFDSAVMVIDLEKANLVVGGTEPRRAFAEAGSAFGNDPAGILSSALETYRKHKTKKGMRRENFAVPLEVQVVRSVLLARYGAKALPFDAAYPVLTEGEGSIWANEATAKSWKAAQPVGVLSYKPECNPFVEPSEPCCQVYWSMARTSPAYEALLVTLVEDMSPTLKDKILPPYSRRRRFLGRVKGFVRRFV